MEVFNTIINFSFSNYGPFKDKQTISFKSSNTIKEHQQSLIDLNVLTTICFYGPNGGGKTSIISAIKTFVDLVTYNTNISNNCISDYQTYLRSINCFDSNKPTTFEISFYKNSLYYTYFVSIENNIISQEKFFYKDKNKNNEFVIFDKEKRFFKYWWIRN